MKSRVIKNAALLALLAVSPLVLAAQSTPPGPPAAGPPDGPPGPPMGPPPGPPPPAQQAAPIDLTGYWVSVISEDWRWRMLTAPAGDVEGVPVNAAGKRAANDFDPSKYGSAWTNKIDCRAYYGAGLMRMPTRLHITWAGPDTLKIESDWGQQTRLLHFKKAELPTGPSPQGSSLAQWQLPADSGGGFGFRGGPAPRPETGKLYVVTDNLVPGWLRRNGVPYSAKAHMSEWFQVFKDPSGTVWFDVTTKVEDPEYLREAAVVSSDFRKEPDGSKWKPHACVQMP